MPINPISLFRKTVKFADIDFSKGIAKRFGIKFNGEIQDILRNGDKITLSIENGRIVKSTRSGKENFTKLFFSEFDKLHDMVYRYDANGNLVSRMKRLLAGYEFSDGNNKVLKETFQHMDDTAYVIKHPKDSSDITTIVSYKDKKPFQLVTRSRYNGEKLLVDFEEGMLDIQNGDCSIAMKDSILKVKDKAYEYVYDLKNKTLSIDGAKAELIVNHPHHAYDSRVGIEKIREHCAKMIPQNMGNRYFKEVIEPMLKA